MRAWYEVNDRWARGVGSQAKGVVRWKPPRVGQLKLNTDASVNHARGRTGLGSVLRDMVGSFVGAKGMVLEGC